MEYRIPNIEYQMHWKGWIMMKDLEKKTRYVSPSPPLSLSLCMCTYLYIYRYSFPSNLIFTFTFTFTYTKFQITVTQPSQSYHTSYLNLTVPLHKTAFSHHPIIHPMHTFTYVLYCTVSTTCRQYLSMYAFTNFSLFGLVQYNNFQTRRPWLMYLTQVKSHHSPTQPSLEAPKKRR